MTLATITGRTDRQTDRQTDRVRRNMRPPPREEGRIKNEIYGFLSVSDLGKSFTIHSDVPPSPSRILWYRTRGDDAL